MMAPMYHPAMKIVGPVRKKLKVKTVFNILGPMLNPARASFAVVGVYAENLVSASFGSFIGKVNYIFLLNEIIVHFILFSSKFTTLYSLNLA